MPAPIKPAAYRYSICGLSMIGATIRYAEMTSTSTGITSGHLYGRGWLGLVLRITSRASIAPP